MVLFNTWSNNVILLKTLLVKQNKIFQVVIVLLKVKMNSRYNLIKKSKIISTNIGFDISVRNTMKNLLIYKIVYLLKTKFIIQIVII
jgi:hypothetical protein